MIKKQIQALNILIFSLLSACTAFAQTNININTPPPPGPVISVSPVGTTGFAQYSYVVVANYASGTAASFTVTVSNGNGTLNSVNNNVIGWQSLPGVITYDILRVPNTGYTGRCVCALAINQSSTTYTDIGGSLSSYTQASAAGAAVGALFLDNVNYGFPKLRIAIDGGTVHLAEVPGGNVLPTYCSPNDLFVLGVLSGSSVAGIYRCTITGNAWVLSGGGGGGASPVGSLGCVQLYATSSTFGCDSAVSVDTTNHWLTANVPPYSGTSVPVGGVPICGNNGTVVQCFPLITFDQNNGLLFWSTAGGGFPPDSGFDSLGTIEESDDTHGGVLLAGAADGFAGALPSNPYGGVPILYFSYFNTDTPNTSVPAILYSVNTPTQNALPIGQIMFQLNMSDVPAFFITKTGVTQFKETIIGSMSGSKDSSSAAAPGAGFASMRWVAGTNSGSCKLVANAGTSATEVTIIDNVGTGC